MPAMILRKIWWAGVEADLAEQNGTEPTNEEILTEVNKRLVVSHNRIRAMMGLDPEQVEDNTSDGSGETTDTDPDGTTEGTTEKIPIRMFQAIQFMKIPIYGW